MADEELKDPQESGDIEDPELTGDGEPDPGADAKAEADNSELQKLQARLAYAERELRRRERQPERQPEPVEKATDKPNPDHFDDYNDYVDKLTDWKLAQREKKEKLQTAEQTRRERQSKIDRVVSEQVAKDPEFLNKAYIPAGLEDYVADSEQFLELAMHFGQNPQQAQDLFYLSQENPVQAAREIGRLEAKLAKTTPAQRIRTNAPEATKKVDGGAEGIKKPQHEMTTEEWFAARRAGQI